MRINIYDISDFIPTGRDNAISRESLANATHMTDRQIRQSIHKARRDIPILNLQDGKGYFIPDKEDPIDMYMLFSFVNQETNRLKSIGWSLKSARKWLKEYEREARESS